MQDARIPPPPLSRTPVIFSPRFLLSKNARTHANFTALKDTGVKFAIDDFGTEHSILDLPGRFPFDYVKTDRQFVAQLEAGATN